MVSFSQSVRTWIATLKECIRQFQRLTVHCVEKGVRDLSIWRCTCARALLLLLVPPLLLIGVELRVFQFASFAVRSKRKALGGAVEVHTVDMSEADQLATLEEALEPTMTAYHQRHHAYKFQVAVNVVFHKAVDPAVVTQPPVTVRPRMAAVYANEVPQLVETAQHLLELIEVYEHNGSGWVFPILYQLN